MAKFVESPRTGTILGNEVIAKPVPFEKLREVQSAGAEGDGVATIEAMCNIIREYVTMADGDSIDTAELSAGAIQKLYMFATDLGDKSVADFT